MQTTDTDIILYDTESVSMVEPTEQKIDTYDLVPAHWPILSQPLKDFDFSDKSIDTVALASKLVETCRKYNGLGLSANQCGLPHRVFVMGANDEYVAYFNPKVLFQDGEKHMEEGCLTIPYLMLKITRPEVIKVEYQDYNGEVRQKMFAGMTARCFLHELDHMNGIMYTSRVKPLALQFAMKKMQKLYQKISKQMKLINRTPSKK